MLRSLRNELRRGLYRPYPYIGFLVCLLIYAVSFTSLDWLNIVRFGNGTVVHKHNEFLLEFNPCRTLLPLAATLPFCAAIAEDWEHRGYYFALTRSSFTSYYNSKFWAAGILGGTVLMLGVCCFLIFLRCFIPLYDESSYYEPFIEPLLHNDQFGLYVLYFGTLQFLLGLLCSSIGCIVAVLTTRRAMIYLTPMLMLAMLEIVSKVTLVGLSGGQSAIVFRSATQTPLHIYCLIAGILLAFSLIAYAVFRTIIRWRIYEWQ